MVIDKNYFTNKYKQKIMTNITLNFYQKNNKQFTSQYNSVDFKSVHQDWLEFLPEVGALIADIGAGSGRDVFWLCERGYQVIAVEPVLEFFDQFKKLKQGCGHKDDINWIVDSLPDLKQLQEYSQQISLILLSAVWMHLTTKERIKSFQTFSILSKINGLLIITLRHGKSPDERVMFPVSIAEIETLAHENHYQVIAIKKSNDQLNRSEVFWETIVLEKTTEL